MELRAIAFILTSLNLGIFSFFILNAEAIPLKQATPLKYSQGTMRARYLARSLIRSGDYSSPSPKESHTWTNWKSCPTKSFVFGMSLTFNHVPNRKDTIKRVQLTCGSINEISANLSAKTSDAGDPGSIRTCDNNGLAVGYHLKQSSSFLDNIKTNEGLGENSSELQVRSNTTSVNVFNKTGMIDLILYCDDLKYLTKIEDPISPNISPSFWTQPVMCGWGEYICALKVQTDGQNQDKITNIKMKCCPLGEPVSGWREYREVPGITLSTKASTSVKQSIEQTYDHHFKEALDYPYYFHWKFCPTTMYVTGIQLQYGARGLHLLCSDMRRPEPRMSEVIYMDTDTRDSTLDEDELSPEQHCEGVAIGIQVRYHPETGIQAVRFFCSLKKVEGQLNYIEGRFPLWKNLNGSESLGDWQKPELCGRNQAICGFKAYTHASGEMKDKFEHFKVKCCKVPEIAEVCYPTDRYELLVECDATEALADTTCMYTQSEGLTTVYTRSESDKRDEQFHQSVAQEWSISQGENDRESLGINEGVTTSISIGNSNSSATGHSSSSSSSNTATNSDSKTSGSTLTHSTGRSAGQTNSTSNGTSRDTTLGGSSSLGSGRSSGYSEGTSKGQIRGSSDTSSRTLNIGQSSGSSDTYSEGVSTGTMSAKTKGTSSTRSSGYSDSYSSSDTRSSSSTRSESTSSSHTAEVGGGVKTSAGINYFGVTAGIEVNFHASYTYGSVSGSENSNTRQSSTTNERSSQRNSQQEGAEESDSKTAQTNKEQNENKSKSSNSEKQMNYSNTKGKETTKQSSDTKNLETNFQTSENVQKETNFQDTNRTNSEKTAQNTLQTNQEESKSKNDQETQESTKTIQGTTNAEKSNSLTGSQNVEKSLQKNEQKSMDRSSEKTRSRSRGNNENRGRQFTTGFDWSKSTSQTFNSVRQTQVTMTVPQGLRTRLYQVVGYCAHYTVRTTKYKRVDTNKDSVLEESYQKDEGSKIDNYDTGNQ